MYSARAPQSESYHDELRVCGLIGYAGDLPIAGEGKPLEKEKRKKMAQPHTAVRFVLGEQDQMTPPKAAKGLIEAAKGAGKAVKVQVIPNGHNQMTESPDATLFAIRDFLAA